VVLGEDECRKRQELMRPTFWYLYNRYVSQPKDSTFSQTPRKPVAVDVGPDLIG
jgi:hypothetical protein